MVGVEEAVPRGDSLECGEKNWAMMTTYAARPNHPWRGGRFHEGCTTHGSTHPRGAVYTTEVHKRSHDTA